MCKNIIILITLLILSFNIFSEDTKPPPEVVPLDIRPGGVIIGPRITSQSWRVTCNSNWDQNCSGIEKLCVHPDFKVCGFRIKILSTVNGEYGVNMPEDNCMAIYVHSNGSFFPLNRWGGSIVLGVTLISHPKNLTITDNEKSNMCTRTMDKNPSKWNCSCAGNDMLCQDQYGNREVTGRCKTYSIP
ncbi:hypothetical protein UYSO10_2476 [Kosakonia radicincitans]|uniref:hypothetical protein n=1 Tax=Kosakonia radicincitans TaxID=283686 RepID=UPI0011841549|nr:hypothetical protein [Kosakonia radicincitans]VVT48732.1 hypothetical protein UYSO10_2476 [Kosakonia radicincitans]